MRRPTSFSICATSLLITCFTAVSQQQAHSRPTAYDVVSIKLEGKDPTSNGFRYTITGVEGSTVTLADMIKEAYGLADLRLVKGATVVKPTYHIIAKLDDDGIAYMRALPPDEAVLLRRQLLQAMLADRFKLRVHHVSGQLNIYSLEVGKQGVKLPLFTEEAGNAKASATSFFKSGRIKGVFTMTQLAQILTLSKKVGSDASDRSVVNNTGLTGRYVIDLTWTATSAAVQSPAPLDTEVYSSAESALDHAGLKLIPKLVVADAITVDSATPAVLD